MSGKTLVFLGLVALAGYSLTRSAPPAPAGASSADSVAISQAGFGTRFQYGIGALGSRMVDGSVRRSVAETEQTLRDMKASIKKARGGDGIRAQQYAKKIVVMDSAALMDLHYGRPVGAIRKAMEAKSLLNSVRQQVNGAI